MKILYVSDRLCFVYYGFVSLLGQDNVVTYPVNSQRIISYSRSPKAIPLPHIWALIHKMKDEFDLIIINSTSLYKEVTIKAVASVLRWNTSASIIAVDWNDLPILHPICYHPRISLYFKREYLLPQLWLTPQYLTWYTSRIYNIALDLIKSQIREQLEIPYPKLTRFKHTLFPQSSEKIKPLSFAIVNDQLPQEDYEKVYDVSFIARTPLFLCLSTSYRVHVYRWLRKYTKVKKIKSYLRLSSSKTYKDTPRLPWLKYMEMLGRSWMSVSCRGFGSDTYRFWEIPYAGAVLVSEYPTIVILNNFTDGYNAIFFNSLQDLRKKLDYYVGNYDELRKMAQRGREHLLKYHTATARAKYILQCIGE